MGSSPVPMDQAVRAKRRILVATSLVTSLIMLDLNIVPVSLPSIARELGAGLADIEWVISAYVLSVAACCSPPAPMPTDMDASARY